MVRFVKSETFNVDNGTGRARADYVSAHARILGCVFEMSTFDHQRSQARALFISRYDLFRVKDLSALLVPSDRWCRLALIYTINYLTFNFKINLFLRFKFFSNSILIILNNIFIQKIQYLNSNSSHFLIILFRFFFFLMEFFDKRVNLYSERYNIDHI